jgi:hypothetical protein
MHLHTVWLRCVHVLASVLPRLDDSIVCIGAPVGAVMPKVCLKVMCLALQQQQGMLLLWHRCSTSCTQSVFGGAVQM